MISLSQLLNEGALEKAAEDFLRQTIKGTEWEGKVFIAGGYVRDELMGKDPKDLDIMVEAPNGGINFANWITQKLGVYVEGSNPVTFPRFGTAKFNMKGVVHNGIDIGQMDIEAVMPRQEAYTPGSRKPEVQFSNLKGDAERRDLTVNAMYKNISTGEYIDPTGKGMPDLKAGLIRTPLNPTQTFTDDPLRMLRVVRFFAKYGWKLAPDLIRALKANAGQLKNISKERIQEELNKMLLTVRPEKAMKLLKITGLMDYVIPEFRDAYNMTQNKYHKHTVWKHTLDVLKNTKPELLNRLMALFHDIGKMATRQVTPKGVQFIGHEKEGAEMAARIMHNLKYPNDLSKAVALGVASHMKLKHGGDNADISDKTLRKFQREVGDKIENILDVIHADNISHADDSSMPNQIELVRKKLVQLNSSVPEKKGPPINGHDIQKALGIKPGPIIGKIMGVLVDKMDDNPNLSPEEAMDIAKSIAGQKEMNEDLLQELKVQDLTKPNDGQIYFLAYKDGVFLMTDSSDLSPIVARIQGHRSVEDKDLTQTGEPYQFITDLAESSPDFIAGTYDPEKKTIHLFSSGNDADPRSSLLVKKVANQLGVKSVESSYYDDTDDSYYNLKRKQLLGQIPDVVFHGTTSSDLQNLLTYGLYPDYASSRSRFSSRGVEHENKVFFAASFGSATFYAHNAVYESKKGFPIIIQLKIPDPSKIVPDYDAARTTDNPAPYNPGWAIDVSSDQTGYQVSREMGKWGYEGRIPSKFFQWIYYYQPSTKKWKKAKPSTFLKLLNRYGDDEDLSYMLGTYKIDESVVRTLKGTPIKRYKNLVGKRVGPQLYVHKNYASRVIPPNILQRATEVLRKDHPGFKFNTVMLDAESNVIRFDEAPDFDTAREPHVGKVVAVFPDNTTRVGQSNNIWHHKWLWVMDDYDGFDVEESKRWSELWLSKVSDIAKGTDASFGAQLKQVGLKETVDVNNLEWEPERYSGLVPLDLDVKKVDDSWKSQTDLYVGVGGAGSSTINKPRYEGFKEFLLRGEPIIMPRIAYDTHNNHIEFGNGRHRFAVLRDMGLKKIPAMIPKEQEDFFKKNFTESANSKINEGEEDDDAHQAAREKTGFWGAQAAGCIFVARDTGRLLIQKRSGQVMEPYTWGTWGGAIDIGEDPKSTVEREVQEESGYTGKILISHLWTFKKDTFRYYNYLVVVDHEFEPNLTWEVDDFVWVEYGEWPSPLHFGLKSLIQHAGSKIKRVVDVIKRKLNKSGL